MSALKLPHRPSTSEARAFWLILVAGAGATAFLTLWALGALSWTAAALAGAAVGGAAGLGWWVPSLAVRATEWWNGLADGCVRVLRQWVLLVTYALVLGLVALAGSRLPLKDREPASTPGGGWTPRETESDLVSVPSPGRGGFSRWFWIHDLWRGARSTRNPWWWTLLPSLVLLSLLGQDDTEETVEGIYTLF